jgi:two-component system, OmpR family, phosphate regulon sensor histidine kinase PhoR
VDDHESDGARLDVEDTGPGIPTEHLTRLTERFYRVDVHGAANKPGSGLGLAIVKHALGRHEATLQIASALGEGTRFSCLFPRTRIRREPSPSAESAL